MIFQQLTNEESGCLSYMIGCGIAGEALVVDPGRDRIDEYLRLSAKRGLKITRILETHTHADHVSGARDLASQTGAAILLHRASEAVFPHESVGDGETLRIGDIDFTVLHTPGHTPDSICLVVTDRSRSTEPWFVLTGDTLFIGDVGRPDLGGPRAAADMYRSLHDVLMSLGDSVEVYPAHGAGSLCGRAMSAKTASTMGFERRFNHLLQARTEAEFVEALMAGIPPKPPSFAIIIDKNKGLLPLQMAKPRPMGATEVWDAVQKGACVVDLREPGVYGEGHVPGAINVWIDSSPFAERVSWFAPSNVPLILLAQGPSDLERAFRALPRVGVDQILGFLQRGMVEWRSAGLPVETVPQVTVHDLATWLEEGRDVLVIDVREPSEWREGHIEGALHLPMLEAVRRRGEIPADRPKAVVCAGGLRSSAVISALKRHGIGQWFNVTGGMRAWQKAGHAVVS